VPLLSPVVAWRPPRCRSARRLAVEASPALPRRFVSCRVEGRRHARPEMASGGGADDPSPPSDAFTRLIAAQRGTTATKSSARGRRKRPAAADALSAADGSRLAACPICGRSLHISLVATHAAACEDFGGGGTAAREGAGGASAVAISDGAGAGPSVSLEDADKQAERVAHPPRPPPSRAPAGPAPTGGLGSADAFARLRASERALRANGAGQWFYLGRPSGPRGGWVWRWGLGPGPEVGGERPGDRPPWAWQGDMNVRDWFLLPAGPAFAGSGSAVAAAAPGGKPPKSPLRFLTDVPPGAGGELTPPEDDGGGAGALGVPGVPPGAAGPDGAASSSVAPLLPPGIPLLKSALQKAVRRCQSRAACRLLLSLLERAPEEACRRLAVIAIEDSCAHPALPAVVWLSAAVSKGYRPGRAHAAVLVQRVWGGARGEAGCTARADRRAEPQPRRPLHRPPHPATAGCVTSCVSGDVGTRGRLRRGW